jgi:hypothetical protein
MPHPAWPLGLADYILVGFSLWLYATVCHVTTFSHKHRNKMQEIAVVEIRKKLFDLK